MTKEEIVNKARRALDLYYALSDPNEWYSIYDCTTEGSNALMYLSSMLLLKLEKDGLIMPFSKDLPSGWREYKNNFGEGYLIDTDQNIISTAKYSIMTACGWVFPAEHNLVPHMSEGYYTYYSEGPQVFWSESLRELEPVLIPKLMEFCEFDDTVSDEYATERVKEEFGADFEPDDTDLDIYRLEECSNCGILLSYHNPKWCKVKKRMYFLQDKHSQYLNDDIWGKFSALVRDIEEFEHPAPAAFTDAVDIDGDRIFINYEYPWYNVDDGTAIFFFNPLWLIPPSVVFDAPKLAERISEIETFVNEVMTKNKIEYKPY